MITLLKLRWTLEAETHLILATMHLYLKEEVSLNQMLTWPQIPMHCLWSTNYSRAHLISILNLPSPWRKWVWLMLKPAPTVRLGSNVLWLIGRAKYHGILEVIALCSWRVILLLMWIIGLYCNVRFLSWEILWPVIIFP